LLSLIPRSSAASRRRRTVGLPGAIIGRSSSSAPRGRTSDGHAGFTTRIGETFRPPYICHRNDCRDIN